MSLILTTFEAVTSGTQSHLSPVHQIQWNLSLWKIFVKKSVHTGPGSTLQS